jgi:hypothetical protein
MKIDGNIITADTGKELYKIDEPEIYGKKIALGINDSPDNWAERDETIETVNNEII